MLTDAQWAELAPLVERCRPHAKVPPHRLEQGVHQGHVDHRDLVHDQQVAFQRLLLAALEPTPDRVDLEQPVQGPGLVPGGLAHPLCGPPGRCSEEDGRC